VFVLTPAGKLIDLIKGATPLDFAYAIHTSIGHSCRGAKVNGQIKPLNYPLRSGEQVEIITVKNGHPNHNWLDPHLGYLHTPRAISRVKSWFKQQQQADNIAAGKQVLEKHYKRLGLKTPALDDLIKHFKVKDADHLYEAIGHGDINPRQLAAALTLPELEPAPTTIKRFSPHHSDLPAISIGGVEGIVTRLAQCCSPLNGDPIIGFITHNRGITIHRQDCETLQHMPPEHQHQLLEATWQGNQPQRFRVPIVIEAQHGTHLLVEVTQLLAAAKVPISDANLKTDIHGAATLQLVIHVESTAQLSQLLARISHLPQVVEVRRRA
jgi:GTP pyrophosphokinase